jgi:tricorn protease
VHLFTLKDRKDVQVVDDQDAYSLSADGEKLLYKKDKEWFVIDAVPAAEGKAKDAKKTLDLSHLRTRIDPRAEWREMFHAAWRLERDLFYNREMNGVDWKAVLASYEKLLPLAGSREDLTYLIGEMLGELNNSHTYVGGGDEDDPTLQTPTGLLGADLAFDRASGRYRFARIYRGDNTRDDYRAPLAAPGLGVKEGDFLIGIDGHPLQPGVDPYSLLVGKAEGTVRLAVAATPTGTPREIIVEPVKQELSLREHDWIEHNRAVVDRLSGGRIAYIYLSNMENLGMQQFIRQFYSQLDKQALIVDDRFNGGGFIDEILLERLRRVLVGMATNRERIADPIPDALIAGPKVTLINQYSASDGDIFPFYFRKYGLGPLIGTRTWGGVRGIRGFWTLLDGGYVTIPEDSLYGLDSQWVLENRGVTPDIEVEDLPADLLAGRDAQLEAGVTLLLEQLKKAPGALPAPPPLLPAYPPNGHE